MFSDRFVLKLSPQHHTKIVTISPYLLQKSPYFFQTKPEPGFYKSTKKRIFVYRSLFLALGILFLYLTGILFFNTPSWNFKFLFGHEFVIKNLLSLIACCFGVASLWIGCSLRTSKEALNHLGRLSKYQLKKAYRYNLKTAFSKENYLLTREEIKTFIKNAEEELDEIQDHPLYKDAKKKLLIIELLLEKQRYLERLIKEFSN